MEYFNMEYGGDTFYFTDNFPSSVYYDVMNDDGHFKQ